MSADQHSDSKATLDRLFWSGIASSCEGSVQSSSEGASVETATAPAAPTPPRSDEPGPVLDADTVEPEETAAGQDGAPVDAGALAQPHEPEAAVSQPESAQEIPSVDSPAIQPVLVENMDAADDPAPSIEPQQVSAETSFYDKKRGEITELMDSLRGSLDRVEQHGRRAESIVATMLSNLRAGSVAHQAVEGNALIEESLAARTF